MPGVDDVEPEIIILYPNPTDSDLTVEIDDAESTESIQMVKINYTYTQYGSGRSMNIDVSTLMDGVYFVIITTDRREVMKVLSVFH